MAIFLIFLNSPKLWVSEIKAVNDLLWNIKGILCLRSDMEWALFETLF